MGRFFALSSPSAVMEGLEIEKLVEQEKNSQNGVFDDLQDHVEETIEKKQKVDGQNKETTPVTPKETEIPEAESPLSGERITNETPSDEETGEETEKPGAVKGTQDSSDTSSKKEGEDKSDEEKVADEIDEPQEKVVEEKITTESMRLRFSMEMASVLGKEISTEDYLGHSSTAGEKAWAATVSGASLIASVGKFLGTRVIPTVASSVFKGVVYAFDRLGHAFLYSFTAITKYLERRIQAFAKLKEDIRKAEQILEHLSKHSTDSVQRGNYTSTFVIRRLVIGKSADLIHNVSVLSSFVERTINDLSTAVKRDILAIQSVIDYSSTSSSINVSKLLDVTLPVTGLKTDVPSEYRDRNPLLEMFTSSQVLPGNVLLILAVPSSSDDRARSEWASAYKDSEIYLGVDTKSVQDVRSIPFLDANGLKMLLKQLSLLCDVCIQHQRFYEEMKAIKLSQRTVYRKYYEGLVTRNRKVSAKESLVDIVVLRNGFIDKVYLPAAIDIHDYSARVITAALSYVEKNIRALS